MQNVRAQDCNTLADAGAGTVAGKQDTFADRLRWAYDRQRPEGRQRGLRLFQRKLSAKRYKDVPGTSLSAIQSYLRGVEPTRPFIEAAAEVLKVRAAWLAFGEGAPTQAEEAARREAGERSRWEVRGEEEFRAHLPWDSMSTASRAHVWDVWGLVLADLPVPLPDHVSGIGTAEWFARDAAQRTARAITAPADALQVTPPGGGGGRELNAYITLVSEALLVLLSNIQAEVSPDSEEEGDNGEA
jgi:hypothetical protein